MKSNVEINIGATPTLDYCYINSPRLKEDIFKRFVDDLNRNRKKDMTFFYNNLESVEIDYNCKKGVCYDAAAQYEMEKNLIQIINNKEVDLFIDHELLHMATTIKDKDGNIYSGFIQLRGKYGIGFGLDEGYTALMDDRYFINRTEYKPERNKQIYCVIKYIAGLLEDFFGQEYMEDLYFSANLLELVTMLSSYTSLEETIQFLHNMDLMLIYFEQKRFRNYLLCLKKYAECNLFLYEAWYTHLKSEYIEGMMTREEYEKALELLKRITSHKMGFRGFPIQSPNISKYFKVINKKVNKKLLHKYKIEILKEMVKEHKIENDKEVLKEEYKKLDKKLVLEYKRKDTTNTN